MSIKFLFCHKLSLVVVGCVLLLLVMSCNNSKYVVYDENLNSLKVDLSNKEKVFILKDFTTCINCLPEIVSFYSDKKEVIIISVVSKSFGAIVGEREEIKRLINDNVQVYFQFSKKNNSYSYRMSNRLFAKYSNGKTSPIIIMVNDKNEIKGLSYQEFLQNVD